MTLSNKIFEHLKLLTGKAILIYHSYLNSRFYQEARFDWTIDKEGNFLKRKKQAEDDIKKLSEYKECVEILSNERDIKPLIGKSIGSDRGMIHFIPDNFVMTFISSFYSNNILLNENSFKKHFDEVENFLFGTVIEESFWVLLLNFEYEGDEIVFNNDIKIRRLNDVEMLKGRVNTNSGLNHLNYTFPDSSHSYFLIEKIIKHDKKIVNEKKIFSGGSRQTNKIRDEFFEILKSLRVIKESDVHINQIFHSEFKKFYPSGGKSSSHSDLKQHMTTLFLDLKANDIDLLLKIYDTIKNDKLDIKVAVNRLFFSKDRSDNYDKLIDLIIGLESLYKSSGSMHLGLRCGLTLAEEKTKAHEIYLFVDEMRELRNQIVHGSSLKKRKKTLHKDDVVKLEHILRDSILLKIKQPIKFKSDSKTWNELYFK